MMKQPLSPFLLLIFFLHCTITLGQSPAPAPAPSGPIKIISVLKKARKYATFIRLLKSTHIDNQLNQQLNELNQRLTVFAPTDSAFSNLKPGRLNSLTDQQKFQLVQFHVVPSFLSIPEFQTVSNPLRTQAGGGPVENPLNITMSGDQVNITTGLVNTTITRTVYTDGRLAVYEIDRVLISKGLLKPPAPAPLSPPPTTSSSDAPSESSEASVDSSGAMGQPLNAKNVVSLGLSVIIALPLWL